MTAYRYLPGAREELNKAAAFYEVSVPGLGDAFLDDVERAMDDIRENPRIGAPIGRALRRAVLPAFHSPSCTPSVATKLSSSQSLITAGVRDTGAVDNDG